MAAPVITNVSVTPESAPSGTIRRVSVSVYDPDDKVYKGKARAVNPGQGNGGNSNEVSFQFTVQDDVEISLEFDDPNVVAVQVEHGVFDVTIAE